MEVWTKPHTDVIAEMMSIATDRATGLLHEMTGEEIALSAPSVSFPSRDDAIKNLTGEFDRRASIVTQTLSGALRGKAAMLFVEDQSAALVKSVIDPGLAMANVSELEAEALCELGNVVLNSAIGVVADGLNAEVTVGLPNISRAPTATVVRQLMDPVRSSVILWVSLKSIPSGLGGVMLFTLDETSQRRLHANVAGQALEVV